MTKFGNLTTNSGVQALNDYLGDRSYVEGYSPSQADVAVFEGLDRAPNPQFAHALRWYTHITSFGEARSKFPGSKPAAPAKVEAKAEEDDDEVDLFGSDDDEEEDAEAARVREERLASYAAKKAAKPGPIAKSQILLDCKPWDDETDMKAMEDMVRTISMDGLVWGASKLNPLAFGIMKLSILCTVEDAKVSVDDLIEKITEFEDYVQSVDVAAFNKV
ncbi:elongation factor 1-beta-like [Portunus trituberculatus]|uniref:elongation factor 1-beta-like n=1 Tax=Portunus trituberculatus TaxID=210409 RepID=UPI001E1D124B|nr:elongation factor 1-beta-like [Portunus trituberculatus]